MTQVATPIPDAPDDSHESDGDRATVLPEFDVDAFARDSELRLQAAQPATGETTTDEARRLLREGKPEEALFLLARLLEQMPLDAEARSLSNECGAVLERDCWAVIGSRSAILAAAVSPDELKAFGLDHVSGFLLSRIDGVSDVDTLLDISGLPRLLALRHLRGLVARGIVAERRRGSPR
jgi:hypothetical protein